MILITSIAEEIAYLSFVCSNTRALGFRHGRDALEAIVNQHPFVAGRLLSFVDRHLTAVGVVSN